MSQDRFCPEHGPYDASLGACPYCSGSPARGHRPSAPPPLDDDDLPTELPGQGFRGEPNLFSDDEETDLGYGGPRHRILDDDITIPPRETDDDVTVLEVEETGLLGLLWVKSSEGGGPRRGKVYPIKHGTIIGRREGSILLSMDEKVSKSHAKFIIEDEQFVIGDLMSANGTFVNGTKIDSKTPLKENDEIRVGKTTFVLKILGE